MSRVWRVLGVVGAVVLTVMMIVVAVYMYAYAGGKQALRARNYLKVSPELREQLYLSGGEWSGGILAGIWGQKVGVWAERGLSFYDLSDSTEMTMIQGCGIGSEFVGDPLAGGEIRKTSFDKAEEWASVVRSGDMVYFSIKEGSRHDLDRVSGIDFWMFLISEDAVGQCIASGREVDVE